MRGQVCRLAGIHLGGPPCQGFSFIGRRNIDDPRNALIGEFMRMVKEIKPKYFVMKNVAGLVAGKSKELPDNIIIDIEKSGYNVVKLYKVLNAKDYGVPQSRRRLFLIGYRAGLTPHGYPEFSGKTVTVVHKQMGMLPEKIKIKYGITVKKSYPTS
jgi:DNA (cytosine-5)-methyltransferase 1